MFIIGVSVVNFGNFHKLFKLKLGYNPQKGYNWVKSIFNFRPVAKEGPGGPGTTQAIQGILAQCFGYTVGSTFQSPKMRLLPPDGRFLG